MYLPAEHVAGKLNLSSEELLEFEAKGVISGVSRVGRTFYSSRDVYRLKAVLHFMRTRGMSVEQAQERMDCVAGLGTVVRTGR